MWLTHEDTPELLFSGFPSYESDEVLANMNDAFHGNYLGEKTLLGVAHEKGMNVASVGSLDCAIQPTTTLAGTARSVRHHGAIVMMISTRPAQRNPFAMDIVDALNSAKIRPMRPFRRTGSSESSAWSNAYAGMP